MNVQLIILEIYLMIVKYAILVVKHVIIHLMKQNVQNVNLVYFMTPMIKNVLIIVSTQNMVI